MTLIRFACDRCGGEVTGHHTATGTGGFYVVDSGRLGETMTGWAKYGRPGEHLVCDACIQKMPAYRKDYGLDPKEDA
jgi:hypothetical protein